MRLSNASWRSDQAETLPREAAILHRAKSSRKRESQAEEGTLSWIDPCIWLGCGQPLSRKQHG